MVSIAKRRTSEAFEDLDPEKRKHWIRMAKVAVDTIDS